ncbi:t-complex protein 1, delta SU (nucleomorph) [Chroomonas mesostigmatica CCMP1168]|uniref:T-complex protein 1 subunit delta n=1 Tax=Chroomonas mesostigmatica CCMP1168 TaxID=1195612 RepID=J7G2J4_9CRYP|nr:t-complex protein 1, delta SU [Chroomonas mesostigmatica CCMP1168]|mmetsp:Transcript_66789/g.164608  ORF Transcript_66789/g.164608 Transcript_66789/m.164608 type:complete len:522 (+) Transcript_66789:1134-2699(+)
MIKKRIQKENTIDFQYENFLIAKAVSDSIRTSLGPHGMDKVIISENEILITNDGATILENAQFDHPSAKMLVDISKSQDQEVGDGTTTIVVLCGSLLSSCLNLMKKGLSRIKIAESFRFSLRKTQEILLKIAFPVDLKQKQILYNAAFSSLESKIISTHSYVFAPIAVNAIFKITNIEFASDINLKNVKILKKLGGIIEQTELLDGLGIDYPVVKSFGGPLKIRNAKIALIQFCLSPPNTDTDSIVVIESYSSMDRILREEKEYLTGICRKIKSSGCNVLLVQKSILREAISPLCLQILSQMKIMIIQDIEREEMSFICDSLGCIPIVDIESFSSEKFGEADVVEEKSFHNEKITNFCGIKKQFNKTATILIRGSNNLLLEEAVRSFRDALCVIRSIIRRRYLIGGGGSAEIEVACVLKNYAKGITGVNSYCITAFANSLEIIPYTLAENAGLEPIDIISQLKKHHYNGEKAAGINIRKGIIVNMVKENIISPLLVITSAMNMAVEFVIQILKIDAIIESV